MKKIEAKLDEMQGCGLLLCRFVIGYVFILSGWGKLQNLDKVIEFFVSIGIPAAHLQAPFVAGVELICGLLVFVGALTRLASIPLIATMVVALITARRPEISGLSDLFGQIEFLYIIPLVMLILGGSGCLSVDHYFCKKK